MRALLARRALAAGKRVAVPRVDPVGPDAAPAAQIADLRRDIEPGYRGIPEPRAECAAIAPEAIDWVLVPGVAFDAAGRRLGLWRRLLRPAAAAPAAGGAARVAGAFEVQIVDRVPAAPHDITVDCIVTESADDRPVCASDRMTSARDRRSSRSRRRWRSRSTRRSRRRRPRCSRRRSRAISGSRPRWIGVFVGIVYAGAMFCEPRERRLRRALRRDPRVAGLRGLLRDRRLRLRALHPARAPCAARARARSCIGLGLRADHACVVASADPHRAAVADGAHVLDQADRCAGRRRARRRPAARRSRSRSAGGPRSPSSPSLRRRRHRRRRSRSGARARRRPATAPRRSRWPASSRRCARCGNRARLLELALACRFVYAATQVCLASFLVVYLTETLGLVARCRGPRAHRRQDRRHRRPHRLGFRRRSLACAPRTVLAHDRHLARRVRVAMALVDAAWPVPAMIASRAAVRRDGDRLERRPARRSRARSRRRARRQGDRRVGLRHVRGRRARAADRLRCSRR